MIYRNKDGLKKGKGGLNLTRRKKAGESDERPKSLTTKLGGNMGTQPTDKRANTRIISLGKIPGRERNRAVETHRERVRKKRGPSGVGVKGVRRPCRLVWSCELSQGRRRVCERIRTPYWIFFFFLFGQPGPANWLLSIFTLYFSDFSATSLMCVSSCRRLPLPPLPPRSLCVSQPPRESWFP